MNLEIPPAQYNFTVSVEGNGVVTLDPHEGPYPEGATVQLLVTPDPGWKFADWSGDLTTGDNATTVVMDADKEIAATFSQTETEIKIQINATPMTATVGQVITYTYSAANLGEGSLHNVALVEDLPGPLENTATATATSVLDEVVSDRDTISVALRALPFTYYLPLGAGNQAPVAMRTGHMRLGKNR